MGVNQDISKLAMLAEVAAYAGGAEIMKYYQEEVTPNFKYDGSPLTVADTASHAKIKNLLSHSLLPIVSEEGALQNIEANQYWLVDPLDGTKDFLAKNNEFTVNVALISNKKPILGVIYAPAIHELYVAFGGKAFYQNSSRVKIQVTTKPKNINPIMAVSRFHGSSDVLQFAKDNSIDRDLKIGASLKYGRMVMGHVDVYPRLVGTSEWDTAAGQAIIEASGGYLIDWETGRSLEYGKPNRRNQRFLAMRSPYSPKDFVRLKFLDRIT